MEPRSRETTPRKKATRPRDHAPENAGLLLTTLSRKRPIGAAKLSQTTDNSEKIMSQSSDDSTKGAQPHVGYLAHTQYSDDHPSSSAKEMNS